MAYWVSVCCGAPAPWLCQALGFVLKDDDPELRLLGNELAKETEGCKTKFL